MFVRPSGCDRVPRLRSWQIGLVLRERWTARWRRPVLASGRAGCAVIAEGRCCARSCWTPRPPGSTPSRAIGWSRWRPWSWSNHLPTGRTFHSYVNPRARHARGGVPRARAERRVPARLSRCSPRSSSALLEFLADSRLVIHNAAFDMRFLNAELRRHGARAAGATAARSTRCSWRSAASPARPTAWTRSAAASRSTTRPAPARRPARLRAAGRGLSAPDRRPADRSGPRRPGAPRRRAGRRAARCARRARMRPRRRSWRRMPRSSPSSTTRSGCSEPARCDAPPLCGAVTRGRYEAGPPAASRPLGPRSARDAEDQGAEPDRRARRRRDDPDHLADDQGQADPALSRRRAALLRSRASSTATPPTTR